MMSQNLTIEQLEELSTDELAKEFYFEVCNHLDHKLSFDRLYTILNLLNNQIPVPYNDRYSPSYLFIAVKSKNTTLTKFFIDAKVDLELKNNSGYECLWISIVNLNIENTKLLLENGANPNSLYDGGSYLHNIIYALNMRHLILKYEDYSDILIKTMILLINAGIDIDAEDSYGQTALDLAINNLNINAAKLLLAAGAKFNNLPEVLHYYPVLMDSIHKYSGGYYLKPPEKPLKFLNK